jgi:DNA (cytosine-5)-methyltransferase 1
MRALDLFCGAGGASAGLARAGFEVVGVDIEPQPEYPFEFVRGDACRPPVRLEAFDFIWASPPCQAHSIAARRWKNAGREYPDRVAETRALLEASGVPFVMENVPGAPLRRDLVLSGGMFGRNVKRDRIFETHGFRVEKPKRRQHLEPLCTVAGHGGNSRSYKMADWCRAMGIDWMSKQRLCQAVPPDYSEYIARAFLRCTSAPATGNAGPLHA